MPIRQQVLSTVQPVVQYGLYEMARTSPSHAMFEVAAISYLMGRGYNYPVAHQIVESWEYDESFPPFQGHGTPYHGYGSSYQYMGHNI